MFLRSWKEDRKLFTGSSWDILGKGYKKTFLVRNETEFWMEAQKCGPWANTASTQSELSELQENIFLQKAQCHYLDKGSEAEPKNRLWEMVKLENRIY